MWNYDTLALPRREEKEKGAAHGELDKEGLSLEPTIVSPHIRRHKDRVIIVDAYDSHRWRRQEKIGKKTTI